jgi:thiol-disulfide isomerase/thioredoxin
MGSLAWPAIGAPPAPIAGQANEPIDTQFTADDRTPEAIAKGQAALEALAKSYRDAKTISDSATIEVITPMGPQKESLQLDFAEGNDLRVRITQMTITALKDMLYVEAEQFSDSKFIGVPLLKSEKGTPDVGKTLDGVAEGFALPLPHLPFRFGGDEAEYLKALSASALEEARIAGFRTDATGGNQILFKGSNGTGVATIDPASQLLRKVAVDFSPPGAPPGLGFTLMLSFNPVVADALKEPVTFDPKSRKQVKTMDDLTAKLSVGEAAPTFSLKTGTGEMVSLSDLGGQVVVLDLWATWCGPCRRGLPLVNEFAQWVKDNNKAVKVFGVNVWEAQSQAMDADAKAQRANEFWAAQKFIFPTLLDLEDKLANDFGPNGIPTTYVIGKDGRIAAIHSGFDPDTKTKLIAEVEKLLAQ